MSSNTEEMVGGGQAATKLDKDLSLKASIFFGQDFIAYLLWLKRVSWALPNPISPVTVSFLLDPKGHESVALLNESVIKVLDSPFFFFKDILVGKNHVVPATEIHTTHFHCHQEIMS